MPETMPIPEPKGLPILGNVQELELETPLRSMLALADRFGEIFRLRLPGKSLVFVTTQALCNEVCNEKRFRKSVGGVLGNVREGVHDGLFTAIEGEENWGIAHRVLMPAFGPISIRSMFDEMHELASQLALKWARHGPDFHIMASDDFTRLTLDTIALCSMGFRFNSFYSPELHPFIDAMGNFLTESGRKTSRLPLPSVFYRASDRKFDEDISLLQKTAREVVESRKSGQSNRRDLLTAMLEGVDPRTDKHMSDESIMDNLITFLIAGHETTSGLLSFAFYQLLRHPDKYRKAQQEVDDIIGNGPIQVDHLSKLHFISAVLKETLRLNATIPIFTVESYEDTVLAGKYPISKDEIILNLLGKVQTDPKVYGDDAELFIPERMLDAEFNRRDKEFPNCWKPFGNGVRSCIGRPFAWQEALLVMAMLLQNFNFIVSPSYILDIKQTLTIKPKDFYMRAVLRDSLTPTTLERRLHGATNTNSLTTQLPKSNEVGEDSAEGVPLTVLYGSNSGTCEFLAHRVASDAASHGFRASKVDCLDSANDKLPTDQPVVIITASYEGQAPDNASHFVSWIESLDKLAAPFKHVTYAVFGCGNHEWAQTFHRIPKLVDTMLQTGGATRAARMGLADVADGEILTNFEAWEDETLWPALERKYQSQMNDHNGRSRSAKPAVIDVIVSNPRISILRQDLSKASVIHAKDLCKRNSGCVGLPKKHLEIKLPGNMAYRTGDYLSVLPINPKETVHRAMRRFSLPRDTHMNMPANMSTLLPSNANVPAYDILSSYVELSQPATKRGLSTILGYVEDDKIQNELSRLAGDAYTEEISAKRVSTLDLLERFPTIQLPLGVFLAMLPPMHIRQYSISSSPLANISQASLTFTVLNEPSLSGTGHQYFGVASNYLDSLEPGDGLHVAVRSPSVAFRLPVDPEQTPIICIAAGTGLAPFRGFVQERAAVIAAGRKKLAPALLFFGCRDPELDDLYRDELDEWERVNAVSVRRAYSRVPEKSNGCEHVQDRIWFDREEVVKLWTQNAKLYICGSKGMANSVRDVAIKLKVEAEKGKGSDTDEEAAQEWFDSLRNTRYVMDVFD
ncbi:cytochrome P450 [Ilyonectria sp. MPI-CAGE-AT-0026]|nr:cytochrome P450 [Ilyonectria sp. MPI-CAGE-AT-0026]